MQQQQSEQSRVTGVSWKLQAKTFHHVVPSSQCLQAGLPARACRKCRGLTLPDKLHRTPRVWWGALHPRSPGASSNVGIETTEDQQVISNTLPLPRHRYMVAQAEARAPHLVADWGLHDPGLVLLSTCLSRCPSSNASEQHQPPLRVRHVQRFRPSPSVLRGRDCHGEARSHPDYLFRWLLHLT